VAAHVAALELARISVAGPAVDGIHLGTQYGIIAFVTGRVFDGLLLGLPAFVGVMYGAGLARRRSGGAPGRPWAVGIRRVSAALFAAVVVTGAVYVAQPARTEPIPGGIAELTTAHVGGHDTGLMLRGQDTTAPVLLYLAGGPGGTDLGAMRLFGAPLERDFLVATWDPRGAGTSYGALDPASTLTFDRAVDDTIELTEQLRARFGQARIYLVGNSYGTLLGVRAVQLRPELFAAYVGTGQMISPVATDRMFYDDTIAWATRTGDDVLLATLRRNGPPPYASVFPYEAALTYEREWNDYPRVPAYAAAGELPANVLVSEYDLVQKVRAIPSFLDSFAALYPSLQGIDFRSQVPRLQVPVHLVEGEHEARGRAVPAREWFDALQAPAKVWTEMPQAGHRPAFEQPERFAEVMRMVRNGTR
jgi:proline iminopeptidase